MSEPFNCPYLMSGLFLKENQIYPCCFVDPTMTRDHIIDYDEPVYNNKMLRQIRKEAAEGLVPDMCKECISKEERTGFSPRLKIIERTKRMKYPTVEIEEYTQPENILFCNIRLHNICNYKCTICFPSNSHLIGKEMGRKNILSKLNEKYYDSLSEDLNKFTNLQFIRIAGGEPLYMKKELFKFLNNLDRRFAIYITTNGSVYDQEIVDLLNEFKRVTITFSIDGMEKFFEYQRANGIWDEVYENLLKYKELPEPFGNHHFNVTVTNTILANMPDFIRMLEKEFPEFLTYTVFNLIKAPVYYQVKLLKDEVIENCAKEVEEMGYKQFAIDLRAELNQEVSSGLINSFWSRAEYIKEHRNKDINDLGITGDFKDVR